MARFPRKPRLNPGRNGQVALLLTGLVAGMVGLSFAAVPLYRAFCQVTGFGGTTQIATAAPVQATDRDMTIRFNADVDPALPWRFSPDLRSVEVKVGEQKLAFFKARNLSDKPITGTATFNVVPLKAGAYFSKVACFCFTEQRLEPGEEVEMPVSFFVDPEISSDPNLDEVQTITLSYTFFRSDEEESQPQTAAVPGTGSNDVN